MQDTSSGRWLALTGRLDGVGAWLAPLGLRLLLAWEFWEAGIGKLRGENWFAGIQSEFPFPFNVAPPGLSWTMATWLEIIGALALLVGLGTRFFAFTLLVLTAVATASVHWPDDWSTLAELGKGYAITDAGSGNYKLPLVFALMLLPLVFHGAGRFSLDAAVSRLAGNGKSRGVNDVAAWGLGCLVLGVPLAMLLPTLGLGLVVIAVLLLAADRLLLA